MKEGERLADLHEQIMQCDSVLGKMEDMLKQFQGSLGDISEEIKNLQDKSFSMNVELKNCQSSEKELAKFIEHFALPPRLITYEIVWHSSNIVVVR